MPLDSRLLPRRLRALQRSREWQKLRREELSPPENPSQPQPPDEAAESRKSPAFAALRHRNFRIFWCGNLLSLIGTFAQGTAQGWLVRLLTPDEFLIALVAACGTLPILLLTLYAGALSDRIDRRRGLLVTNGIAACFALLLALLSWWGHGPAHPAGVLSVPLLALLAVGIGAVNAFDIPIRQSFNIEMVSRDDLPNAIALNSSAFNGARVAGPAVGGFLLPAVGVTGCFLVNALSFFALIGGLLLMRLPPRAIAEGAVKTPALQEIREGFVWVKNHPTLRLVLMLTTCCSIFGMSFQALLPVFAKDVFHTDARGFALLLTCNGLGGLGAALSLAAAGRMRHRGKRLLLGAFLFALCVIAFALSPNLAAGCVCLILAGWFLLAFLMTANTLVQTLAPDELRGRVFSIYSLSLVGTSPIGALVLGALAKGLGTRGATALSGTIAASVAVGMFVRFRRLWKEK